MGLTFEARQAGTNAAASVPAARTNAAAATVGSVAVMPNNCDCTSLPSAATQGSAIAMPATIMATASRRTSRMAEPPVAPRASADPDLPRAAGDDKGHHAVEADEREQQGEGAEAPESAASMRSVFSDRLTCSSSVRKERIGSSRVGLADDVADGLEGLVGRAAYLDVERAAEVIAFEDREEDLLGIFAEVAITEIGDDADDYGLRLDIRAGALTDEDAEGIDARKVAADERLVDDGGAAAARLAGGTDVAHRRSCGRRRCGRRGWRRSRG